MELSFPPLTTGPAQTATDQVFDLLYSAVISLRLPPGTKISEVEIARQLDVSRQPVRDAFFRLSKLGFVLIRPQRATLVTKISVQAVRHAVFVRTALEVECLRLVATRRTDDDLRRLRDEIARQDRALGKEDASIFHGLDETFHLALCEIAGHAHVWDLIREQKAHMDRIRFLSLSDSRRREVLADHAGLVAAVERGDPAAAERGLRDHLGHIESVLSRIRADHPAYFDEPSA